MLAEKKEQEEKERQEKEAREKEEREKIEREKIEREKREKELSSQTPPTHTPTHPSYTGTDGDEKGATFPKIPGKDDWSAGILNEKVMRAFRMTKEECKSIAFGSTRKYVWAGEENGVVWPWEPETVS